MIVKYASFSGENLAAQLRISYEPGDTVSWQPSRWTATFHAVPSGNVVKECEATVDEVSLSVPIADDLFRIEFPPDTIVTDFRKREKWLVLPGGNRRIITAAELNRPLTLAGLRSTRAGELDPAAARRGFRMSAVWVGINVSILLALATLTSKVADFFNKPVKGRSQVLIG